MKRKAKILAAGIATMDIYCHQGRMYPGGNEYNIAYNSHIQGAQAAFMGIFADDRAGKLLEETLRKRGIDTSFSHHEKGASGYALVDIRDGDRVFLDWNKQGVTDLYPFDFTKEEIDYMKTFDVTCISWGARVTPVQIKKLKQSGVFVCYDFYDNFTDKAIQEIAPYIQYAFFSCSHLTAEETKDVLQKAADFGCEIAVGTRGSNPTIAWDGMRFYEQKTYSVEVKDTMGAGDAYISAFLTNYLSVAEADEFSVKDDKIQYSLSEAAKFAAQVVAKDGALGIGYDVDVNWLSELIHLSPSEHPAIP